MLRSREVFYPVGIDNLRHPREHNPLLRLSKLATTIVDRSLINPVIHTGLLGFTALATLFAGAYMERAFLDRKLATVNRLLSVEEQQADAIWRLVRANKPEGIEIAVVPWAGAGYVKERGLASRDFPDPDDPKNLFPYNHRLFPDRDGLPSIHYTHKLVIKNSDTDWEIWTVRPEEHEPSMSGGWIFSAEEFNRDGKIEQFISKTPLDKLVADVVYGISQPAYISQLR